MKYLPSSEKHTHQVLLMTPHGLKDTQVSIELNRIEQQQKMCWHVFVHACIYGSSEAVVFHSAYFKANEWLRAQNRFHFYKLLITHITGFMPSNEPNHSKNSGFSQ